MLNRAKLQNIKRKSGGAIAARCPACAEEGHDRKGEHLIVFSDGKFGCVKHQGDNAHNRRIWQLVGDGKERITPRIKFTPLVIPPSRVIQRITLESPPPGEKDS